MNNTKFYTTIVKPTTSVIKKKVTFVASFPTFKCTWYAFDTEGFWQERTKSHDWSTSSNAWFTIVIWKCLKIKAVELK